MKRYVPKRSTKAGLPPGTLIHLGERIADSVTVTRIVYGEESFQEEKIAEIHAGVPLDHGPRITWIHVQGIHDVPSMEAIGRSFDIHPLILEDILNTDQRPKLDDMDTYLYVVLKMMDYDTRKETIVSEQVSLILGPSFVISFQEGQRGDVLDPVRDRIRTSKGKIRRMGPDYLFYALLDSIVDHYFVVLETIGEKIEHLEEQLVADPKPDTSHTIHHLKREMIVLRKSIWPVREVIAVLEKGDSGLIQPSTRMYLRDVYDHTVQVIDTIETYRDMLSGILDIYLSSISNRLNQVMKVLTIIATIFMPLTFIAGIYGMNFAHMPELQWRWGYPAVLGVMCVIACLMMAYFKMKRWL